MNRLSKGVGLKSRILVYMFSACSSDFFKQDVSKVIDMEEVSYFLLIKYQFRLFHYG